MSAYSQHGRPRAAAYIQGALLGAILTAGAAGGVAAQEITTYGVAAADGDNTNIQLIGLSARPGDRGLQPVLSFQAYRLGYDAGLEDVTVYSFTPAAGVGYRTNQGSVEVKQGYSFQNNETDIRFFEGTEDGWKTSFQAIYWGGEPELQALASYAWENSGLYSQAQGTYAVANLNPGEISVGAEVVWQGDLNDSGEYESTSFGPVLRWASGGPLIATLSGGLKDSNFTDSTYYLKLAVVFAP